MKHVSSQAYMGVKNNKKKHLKRCNAYKLTVEYKQMSCFLPLGLPARDLDPFMPWTDDDLGLWLSGVEVPKKNKFIVYRLHSWKHLAQNRKLKHILNGYSSS